MSDLDNSIPEAGNRNFLISQDFFNRVQRELEANAASKGDWRDWQPNLELLDSEIQHHIRKLNDAAARGDSEKVAEYAADVAAYAMKYYERFGARSVPEAAPNKSL